MAEPTVDTQAVGTADTAANQASAGAGGFTAGGHTQKLDVGQDELMEYMGGITAANVKRTADLFQSQDLNNLSDQRAQAGALTAITNQLLTNMVGNSDLIMKQAIRHSDLAIKNQFDVENIAETVTARVLAALGGSAGGNSTPTEKL